ncbi:MAG: hypothetical protein CO158_06685 [Piscirickettsiaceae bacterium CG_4_9_14_3_um_filter_43_564]|nr:hypothetical protein [Thiomicrospira sp.]OIP93584.1 MAG: hypothetical protein AUK56_11615 [Thiomicrospira sp. CG2_30_44_34]PIQ04602.1 MAG: hypothetical protein COW74_04805 [Piscirickettsiaceae bacterium CG18_big_fil_WC_8_21_14_2_50_44_103]PIU39195.1 MAG: hypothetical protein COT01_02695 [Piscirickettsiaceae bacterium CG07_land_8_20_14_0_80_44_28]PIW57844.1 MAG: hypothetical protein COW14_04045 [Piscirickettsiaceae bacterium CG12_big_fil_rev_8_21_14_0_65_44_934]PIW77656.1 MAG: hypothetical p
MKSISNFVRGTVKASLQTVLRFIGLFSVAMVMSACSSTPCQEVADDPESSQAVLAKDLAIPPNLLNPAVENKLFNDAVKPTEEKQP